MNEEDRFQPYFGDYDFLKEKPIEDDFQLLHVIPKNKNELIIPDKLYLKDYIKYPEENSYRDYYEEPLQNIIQLPRYNENIEKKQIYEPLLGKLSLNSIIKDPLTLVPKPSSFSIKTPSWLSQNSLQSSLGYYELGALQPEDLPELTLPILDLIEDTQPHIVIGCDRGGRLFGLAIHAAWGQTRDGQPFPTLDSKLHFARISKSEDADVLQDKVDQIVASAKQLGAQRGNELADDEQLRVLFVDDWVIGGGTMRLAQRLMKKHGAKTYFAVMCGEGADATGQANLHTNVSWHDRPEEIGVNYLSTLQEDEDGNVTQKQEVIAVRGKEAISNRKRIHTAAKALAKVRVLEKVA
jgi:adenine/guanine phosphoribosyltransferase-like PRPP-binding protein